MKVLVSAIACHPAEGSEGGVGWKAITALSRCYEVHVLTSLANKDAIEKELRSSSRTNLTFTFFGTATPYHKNRLVARGQSWLRYLDWIKQSSQVASELQSKHRFDLVHHVTYSSWRVPSPLWSLGIPLVWGPVGGMAEFPLHLLGKLSPSAAAFELFRTVMNRASLQSRALRNCLHNAAAVIGSNRETFDKLLALRGKSDGMHLLFPTFFTDQQIDSFQCDPADKPTAGPIRLFTGGNIIGSKGLVFALEALKTAAQQGINWRLTVGGYGPEVPFLKKRARALEIDQWIDFHMGFSGEDYINKLKESHILILPSFRENAGITMLEAMLAGCVPIIVDASAQAGVVDNLSGFKIPIGSASTITVGLAKAFGILSRNTDRRIQMGRNASELVQRSFREETYMQKISIIYKEALLRHQSHNHN